MSAALEILEKEFCPLVDPGVVRSIFHDYEGEGDDEYILRHVRAELEPIRLYAVAEQESDFDPSGSGATRQNETTGQELSSSEIEGASTELSSLSLGEGQRSDSMSSSENISDMGRSEYMDETEGLDTATKEALLYETFPSLTLDKISYTLKRCDLNYGRALDELLNAAYFEETVGSEKVSSKGIDAFYVDDSDPSARRKRKGRKGRNGNIKFDPSLGETTTTPQSPTSNKWQTGSEAIGFLSTRLGIPATKISPIFYRLGGDLSATTMYLLDEDNKKHGNPELQPEYLVEALRLKDDFPVLDLQDTTALIRLAHPSTAAAHEVAKAITRPKASTPNGGIRLVRQYAPINLSDPETPFSPKSPSLPNHTHNNTASLSAARSTAFMQAAAAHRKGKSDHLMRSAAAFYGQVARDYGSALHASQASDADALAASQSSARQLDLHGINVKDATRISREYVTMWWHGLGDSRYVNGGSAAIGSGYRIITGKGSHSVDGRGKLGPAVAKMLVREGWKVEIGSGSLTVTGVAKRR